jgi:8-oxo-dGTP pyrophosphatase MutT (NUDIX family)
MAFQQQIPEQRQPGFCTNCGTSGHVFRQCVEPVSSYGVLVFRWVSRKEKWPQQAEFCQTNKTPTGISNLVPQVLMIQRKDSLGFMDIMRGKYRINEPEYISKQLRGMTPVERDRLLNDDFDAIWNDLWGGDSETSQRYAHNKHISKDKLTQLRNGIEISQGIKFTLADLLRQEPALYDTPEWGFPKGRRDLYESDIKCAYRELAEETGILEQDLFKVINVAPFIEQFYGSNNIHYRHTYYIAHYIGTNMIHFDEKNNEMTREIGNIVWKGLDEALVLLRPENVEKRGILIQLANLLRNFSPILYEPLEGQMIPFENKEGEQQEKYVFVRQLQQLCNNGRGERSNTLHWRTTGGYGAAGGGARRSQQAAGRGGAISRYR